MCCSAGSDNHAGTSLQDAMSQDVENNAVRGASDCDVFYDAVSLFAPLTAAFQDFWDNLDTEPSSDNPFDDAASSLVITACDSGESDIFFPCHMGTEPSARQVNTAALLSARPAQHPSVTEDNFERQLQHSMEAANITRSSCMFTNRE